MLQIVAHFCTAILLSLYLSFLEFFLLLFGFCLVVGLSMAFKFTHNCNTIWTYHKFDACSIKLICVKHKESMAIFLFFFLSQKSVVYNISVSACAHLIVCGASKLSSNCALLQSGFRMNKQWQLQQNCNWITKTWHNKINSCTWIRREKKTRMRRCAPQTNNAQRIQLSVYKHNTPRVRMRAHCQVGRDESSHAQTNKIDTNILTSLS